MDCLFLFSGICCYYRSFTIVDAYSSIFVVPRAHLILCTDGPVWFQARHCHIERGEQAINEFSRVVDIDSHKKILKLWPALVYSILARLQQFNYGLNTEVKRFLMISLLLYDDYYQHNNTVASQLANLSQYKYVSDHPRQQYICRIVVAAPWSRYQSTTFVWPTNTTNRNDGILIVWLSQHPLDSYSLCLCHS